ncbi:hypothetical protein [Sporomusa aerivorans]|uniref:hypothetical protein n=1 Tax=Sporomusa aerivorans TaxID=204936 RepID=UPI00352BAE11
MDGVIPYYWFVWQKSAPRSSRRLAKRFGLGLMMIIKIQHPRRNIARECCDLIAVIELREEAGVIQKTGSIETIEKKKSRVRHYMEYAREHGTLG